MNAARIRDDDPALAQLGISELRDSCRSRMNPFQLSRPLQLLWTNRIADENLRVRQFSFQAIVIRQMNDVHRGPSTAHRVRHRCGRTPQIKRMPDANQKLRFRGPGAIHLPRRRAQVATGHFDGLGLANHSEESGSNVAKRPIGIEAQRRIFRRDDKRNRIRRVVRMRTAGFRDRSSFRRFHDRR